MAAPASRPPPRPGPPPSFLDRIQHLSLSEEGVAEPPGSEGSDEPDEDVSHLVVLDPNHVRRGPLPGSELPLRLHGGLSLPPASTATRARAVPTPPAH